MSLRTCQRQKRLERWLETLHQGTRSVWTGLNCVFYEVPRHSNYLRLIMISCSRREVLTLSTAIAELNKCSVKYGMVFLERLFFLSKVSESCLAFHIGVYDPMNIWNKEHSREVNPLNVLKWVYTITSLLKDIRSQDRTDYCSNRVESLSKIDTQFRVLWRTTD